MGDWCSPADTTTYEITGVVKNPVSLNLRLQAKKYHFFAGGCFFS
jgi:hypothetical protein